MLSPNIYRNTSEALESFDYISNNGLGHNRFLYVFALKWVILSVVVLMGLYNCLCPIILTAALFLI
ncbi:hypothetical protein HanPI659440_Chr11g0414121 [Helianthus annuus]|nr:hypothetical protein HanPI659440_Chr11g0414121 [Helianthus annuus]